MARGNDSPLVCGYLIYKGFKKNTHKILKQINDTQRPVILTVNGRAEAVLVDAIQYDKIIKTG
jgi:prevent-host-death family protein